MAKVRRASPKSSSPLPPLQHRAKWRPNAKRSPAHFACLLTLLATLHPGPIVLHLEWRWQYPTKQAQNSTPPSTSLTRRHATTFRPPSYPLPSAVGDFGFQIVFVLLLPQSSFYSTPGPHTPPLPRQLYLLRPNPVLATSYYYVERRLSVSAARFHQRPAGSASVHMCVCVCVWPF